MAIFGDKMQSRTDIYFDPEEMADGCWGFFVWFADLFSFVCFVSTCVTFHSVLTCLSSTAMTSPTVLFEFRTLEIYRIDVLLAL